MSVWRAGLDNKVRSLEISLTRLCIKSRVTQMREKEISHDSDSCGTKVFLVIFVSCSRGLETLEKKNDAEIEL